MSDPDQGEQIHSSLEISPASPEKRRKRYLASLERLESMDPQEFYPDGVRMHNWEQVDESPELEEFMRNFSIYDTHKDRKFDNRITRVFRNKDSGRMFAVPAFPSYPNARQVILDSLATVSDLIPTAMITGFKWRDGETFFQPKTKNMFTFQGKMIVAYPAAIEDLINGLGDEKFSNDQRTKFLAEDISAFLHEAVHIANEQDLDLGGPHRVLSETASTTMEYLAFPGRNPKMSESVDKAVGLLRGEGEGTSHYDEALLIGMLVSAQDGGFLNKNDDKETLAESLDDWRKTTEGLSENELRIVRNSLQKKYFISERDEKLIPAVINLGKLYPKSLRHLQLMEWDRLQNLTQEPNE